MPNTLESKILKELQNNYPINTFDGKTKEKLQVLITLAFNAGRQSMKEEVMKILPKEKDGECHSDYGEGIQDGFNQFLSELLDKLKTL